MLPRNFIILKVTSAEADDLQRPNGNVTLLGFDSVATAKELVSKLKATMSSQESQTPQIFSEMRP